MGETLAGRHPRPEGRGVNLGDTLPAWETPANSP